MISALILLAFFTLSSRVSFTTGFGGGYRNLSMYTVYYIIYAIRFASGQLSVQYRLPSGQRDGAQVKHISTSFKFRS